MCWGGRTDSHGFTTSNPQNLVSKNQITQLLNDSLRQGNVRLIKTKRGTAVAVWLLSLDPFLPLDFCSFGFSHPPRGWNISWEVSGSLWIETIFIDRKLLACRRTVTQPVKYNAMSHDVNRRRRSAQQGARTAISNVDLHFTPAILSPYNFTNGEFFAVNIACFYSYVDGIRIFFANISHVYHIIWLWYDFDSGRKLCDGYCFISWNKAHTQTENPASTRVWEIYFCWPNFSVIYLLQCPFGCSYFVTRPSLDMQQIVWALGSRGNTDRSVAQGRFTLHLPGTACKGDRDSKRATA